MLGSGTGYPTTTPQPSSTPFTADQKYLGHLMSSSSSQDNSMETKYSHNTEIMTKYETKYQVEGSNKYQGEANSKYLNTQQDKEQQQQQQQYLGQLAAASTMMCRPVH